MKGEVFTMYIVLIIQNGTTVSALTYTDINDARAKYHTELAYRHESRTSTTCIMFDSSGTMLARESYVMQTEPENEEVN